MLRSAFSALLTWWGAILLGVLDSSVFFFLPFGADALVVYLAARDRHLFWLYPLLVTAGSVLGAAGTYWIGARLGEAGLSRLVDSGRLDALKTRVHHAGALTLAVPAMLPPPFPLSAFVLIAGALNVSRLRFFGVFATTRIVRFGLEGLLARIYGDRVLTVMESRPFGWAVGALIAIAIAGTAASVVVAWRRASRPADLQ